MPDASRLNWAELYFKSIVFDGFEKGFEKMKLFCLVLKVELIIFNEVSAFNLIAQADNQ